MLIPSRTNPFPLHSRALLAFAYQKPHSSTLGRNVGTEIDIRVPDGEELPVASVVQQEVEDEMIAFSPHR